MPKRKAPDRRRARRSWLMSSVSAMAGLAMNHPAVSGGTLVFGVIFSFVAANALWYQPPHPHPFLDTRTAFKAYVARAATIAPDENSVTTFKIERQGTVDAATTTAKRNNTPDTVTEVIVLDDALSGSGTTSNNGASELVRQIQQNLSRRGLYDGKVDGLMGPQTEAAIAFYQETRGMETTGKPDTMVLNALKVDNSEFAVVPPDRPQPEITNAIARPDQEVDTVAEVISDELHVPVPVHRPERVSQPVKVEPVVLKQQPAKVRQPAAITVTAEPGLVTDIQKGLSNLAYADVVVDGVAGSQTKAAIRRFQKHYRLPETGEPDKLVLEKLKQIGAL